MAGPRNRKGIIDMNMTRRQFLIGEAAFASLGAGDVRFTVTPINCFGARGKPLSGEYKAS